MVSDFIVGQVYKICHIRKGTFKLLVKNNGHDDWLCGEIVEGETRTILPENEKGVGDNIRREDRFSAIEQLRSIISLFIKR